MLAIAAGGIQQAHKGRTPLGGSHQRSPHRHLRAIWERRLCKTVTRGAVPAEVLDHSASTATTCRLDTRLSNAPIGRQVARYRQRAAGHLAKSGRV